MHGRDANVDVSTAVKCRVEPARSSGPASRPGGRRGHREAFCAPSGHFRQAPPCHAHARPSSWWPATSTCGHGVVEPQGRVAGGPPQTTLCWSGAGAKFSPVGAPRPSLPAAEVVAAAGIEGRVIPVGRFSAAPCCCRSALRCDRRRLLGVSKRELDGVGARHLPPDLRLMRSRPFASSAMARSVESAYEWCRLPSACYSEAARAIVAAERLSQLLGPSPAEREYSHETGPVARVPAESPKSIDRASGRGR